MIAIGRLETDHKPKFHDRYLFGKWLTVSTLFPVATWPIQPELVLTLASQDHEVEKLINIESSKLRGRTPNAVSVPAHKARQHKLCTYFNY